MLLKGKDNIRFHYWDATGTLVKIIVETNSLLIAQQSQDSIFFPHVSTRADLFKSIDNFIVSVSLVVSLLT